MSERMRRQWVCKTTGQQITEIPLYSMVATLRRSDGCKHHRNRRADSDTSHRVANKRCFLKVADRGHCTSCCSVLARLSPKFTDPSWSSSGREPWSSKAWGEKINGHKQTAVNTQSERRPASVFNYTSYISAFKLVNKTAWYFYTWLHNNRFSMSAQQGSELNLIK